MIVGGPHSSPALRKYPARPCGQIGYALPRAVLALLVCVLVSACSPYKLVGDQFMKLGEKVILPHELAGADLGIGCRAATAFTPAAIAFERVGTDVNRIGELLLLTSGVCEEQVATEHELAFLRAMRSQDPITAQNARIEEKRAYATAARREYAAYKRFIAHYGDPREGTCPKFRNEFDELVFMVGMIAGVQAMINDAQTGQLLNVPRDIAPKIGYLVGCLDSKRWWNLPTGVRAALWYSAPMLAPPNVDPAAIMEDVANEGGRAGVRLGHVIWTLTTYNSGDIVTTKRAIREFAAAGVRYPQNEKYRILDVIAVQVVREVSDRIWSEEAGYRTPMNALGTFPDDPKPDWSDIDDLIGP